VTAAEKEVVATAAAAARGRSMSTSSDPVERQIVEQERASIMKVRACINIGWKSESFFSLQLIHTYIHKVYFNLAATGWIHLTYTKIKSENLD